MNSGFGKVGLNFGGRSAGNGLGQIVQIIQLPQALSNNAKTLRLEGEITQVNRQDNTARIQTPEGEINVQVKSKDLKQGQRLTVDVPAGRPPKQVKISPETIIRQPQNGASQNSSSRIITDTPDISARATPQQNPSPTLTQKVIQKISQKLGNTPPPQTSGSQNTQQNQNVTINSASNTQTQNIAKQLAAQAVKNIPNIPQTLQVDDVVRLLNTTPALAQEIATQSARNINLIQQFATEIRNSNVFALLNAQTTAPKLSAPITPQTQIQTPNPILSNITIGQPVGTVAAQQSLTQVTLPQQTPITQIITTSQTLNSTQVTAVLQTIPNAVSNTPQTATTPAQINNIVTSLQPIIFDPINPNNIIAQKAQQIDIQILKITPPNPNIITPTQNTATQNIQSVPAAIQFVPPIISSTSAPAISAQVTGFTPQGLPLVTAKLPGANLPQSFVMQYRPNNLVIGSQLQIIPKSSGLTPLQIQSQPANPLLQGFQWPALDELYNGLLQVSPQAAASLSRSLPNATNPTQMGAAAMMFIAAVKSGDMAGFIGDKKIDLLQRVGKENLLSRLVQGDGSTRATPEAASSAEWRAIPLPMFWEGEIQRITLYTRNEQQNAQDDQENKNGQTRFVFDLSLSRMGNVQLDGFLKDQRLDLVIRTENAFSQPMQQTMRQAYTGALDQTSLSGDLNFQGNTDNWVHVLENEEQYGENA